MIKWLKLHKTTLWLVILVVLSALAYVFSMWLQSKHTNAVAERVLEQMEEKGQLENLSGSALKLTLQEVLEVEAHTSTAEELLVHIAIALFVAVILVLLVDATSAAETERRVEMYIDSVAQSVWSAVLRRMLPDGIAREIDEVSRSQVVKKDCRYTLTFSKPYEGLGADQIVLHRKLLYSLENITNKTVSHEIRAIITSENPPMELEQNGERICLPRHLGFSIDNVDIPLMGEKGGALRKNDEGHLAELRYTVDLREGESKAIFLSAEELMPIQGNNTYVQATPAYGLTLFIDNKIQDCITVTDVDLQHPRRLEFVPKSDGIYEFKGGMLPGQAFCVFWRRV